MVQLTFVLIRGLARGNAHWLDFPERLKASFPNSNIECLEIPGNGDRNSEMTPLDPLIVIHDFRRTIFQKYRAPICLIGVSLGGMLALKWAEEFPNDIQSAFILNSSLGQISNPFLRLRPAAYGAVFSSLFAQNKMSREKNILNLISNLKSRDEITIQKFGYIANKNSTNISNFFRQLILANAIRILGKPKSEIFVLTSKDDKMVSYKCSIAIADFLSAPYFVHQTAGHDLTLDDPDWVIAKIQSCIGN